MDLTPLYRSYLLYTNAAAALLNLFLCGLFLFGYLRHRTQRGFLFLAVGSLGVAFTAGYHFLSSLQHRLGAELWPAGTWRLLAYLFFVVHPLAFLCYVVGPILLVCTYGRTGTDADSTNRA